MRQIRAMLYAWERHGLDKAEAEFHAKYASKRRSPFKNQKPSFTSVLKGRIDFLRMVRGENDPLFLKYYNHYHRLRDPAACRAKIAPVTDKRVFICYSRRQEPFARWLAASLEEIGAQVWIDVEDIPIGMNWSSAVETGLQACGLMLLIVTPESMSSSHVREEWQYFHEKRKTIIPLVLEGTDLPYQIARNQSIVFHNRKQDEAFVELHFRLKRDFQW